MHLKSLWFYRLIELNRRTTWTSSLQQVDFELM